MNQNHQKTLKKKTKILSIKKPINFKIKKAQTLKKTQTFPFFFENK